MDVNLFKNILYIQHKEDTYINIEKKRINTCKRYIKKSIEDNNYYLSCEYRLFGKKENINNMKTLLNNYLNILKLYKEDYIIKVLLDLKNFKDIEKKLNDSEKKISKITTFDFFLSISEKYIISIEHIENIHDIIMSSYEKSCEFYNDLFINKNKITNLTTTNVNSGINPSLMYQMYFYLKGYWNKKKEVIDTSSYDNFVNKIKDDGYIKNINSKNAKIRLKLWYETYGNTRYANCYCCDKSMELNDPAWHCGHILSRKNGGTFDLSNLKPICVKCNLDMGIQNMYQYIIYNEKKGYKNIKGMRETQYYEKNKNKYINSIKKLVELENCKKIPLNISNWLKKQLLTENDEYFSSTVQFIEKYEQKF